MKAKEHPELSMEEIKSLVDSVNWYHIFEVYPGIVTPGRMHVMPSEWLDDYDIPKDLTGMKVLEIGAFDGAFTFELERRGADVTAMDVQVKEHTGFAVAHRINQSKVKYIQCDVTDLNPAEHGTYDLVVFLGVFYHILHPLKAFQNIYSVIKGAGTVHYSGLVLDYGYKIDPLMAKYEKELKAIVKEIPLCHFAREEYQNVWSNWYIPNMLCLRDWLTTAGFEPYLERVFQDKSTMYGVARKNPMFKLAPGIDSWLLSHATLSLRDRKEYIAKYKRILFFGAGGRLSENMEDIQKLIAKENILGVLDNDPDKQGSVFEGMPVVSLSDIPILDPDLIIVMSAYAIDIMYQLKAELAGVQDGKVEVLAVHEMTPILDTSLGHEIY